MGGGLDLPCIAVESTAAAGIVAANGGLSTSWALTGIYLRRLH